jgi:HNH endonuclease
MKLFDDNIACIPESGCWIWMRACTSGGYGKLRVGGRLVLAHRFAWELTRGPIPTGIHVLHRCDVPSCVNPKHLFLGSHADNMRDKCAKGRHNSPRGIRNGRSAAKLSADQVAAIRGDQRSGRSVALEYGVSKSSVCKARSGRTWGYL